MFFGATCLKNWDLQVQIDRGIFFQFKASVFFDLTAHVSIRWAVKASAKHQNPSYAESRKNTNWKMRGAERKEPGEKEWQTRAGGDDAAALVFCQIILSSSNSREKEGDGNTGKEEE